MDLKLVLSYISVVPFSVVTTDVGQDEFNSGLLLMPFHSFTVALSQRVQSKQKLIVLKASTTSYPKRLIGWKCKITSTAHQQHNLGFNCSPLESLSMVQISCNHLRPNILWTLSPNTPVFYRLIEKSSGDGTQQSDQAVS